MSTTPNLIPPRQQDRWSTPGQFQRLNATVPAWVHCTYLPFVLALTIAAGEPLIAPNSSWKYWRGSEAPNQNESSWWQPHFNDASWPLDTAPFRYGDGSAGTVLTDMATQYPCVLLRSEFHVEDVEPIAALDLSVNFDDGFKVWINGNLVFAVNAPQDNSLSALATDSHESGQYEVFELPKALPLLVQGKNCIAIQGFNVSLSSSDFLIDAALVAIEKDPTPPAVEAITPSPGQVENLQTVTLRFTEPVVGIDAEDLRLNNVPADTVNSEGNQWTFTFPQPAFGRATLAWHPKHGIRDLARPPNPFNATHPEETRSYQLVDHTRPTLTSILPPPDSTVRSLDRITVFFSEPIQGMTPSDLRINGRKPKKVDGFSVGPWELRFEPIHSGTIDLKWAPNHNIIDRSPNRNRLDATGWSYTVDSRRAEPNIVINEVVSSNQTGLRDEDGETVDWIELWNRSNAPINLRGWSLTDDKALPDQWTFPSIQIPPNDFLLVFASGKDRRDPTRPLHTNFKLDSSGGYLALFNADLPRQSVGRMPTKTPPQRAGVSYGATVSGRYRLLATPTPGAPNQDAQSIRAHSKPTLNRSGGIYRQPLSLEMTAQEPNTIIRFTTNFTRPTADNGAVYLEPIQITTNTVIRAAVFSDGSLPSPVVTQSFFIDNTPALHSLPMLSLATEPSHLRGESGIMERNPRNTTKRGIEWERPVSAELLFPDNRQEGFQIDCGLRIQGGDYIRHNHRPNTAPPTGKYSFRLYFRGEYGHRSLDYPFFKRIPRERFQHLTLRAGMNDPINPFIVDELIRRLNADMGQAASQGTIVNLMLNGVYQGYYNPTERIDRYFLQSRHGGGAQWDLIAQREEVREGDKKEWNRLLKTVLQNDLQQTENYRRATRQLDIDNFIDYLILNIYVDMDDWPGNNWRAARERVPRARWRFYVWDGERAFGTEGKRTLGTLSRQRWPQERTVTSNNLTRGPLAGSSEIARMFRSLIRNSEFRLRFADRVHRHFFNNGALTKHNIAQRHRELVNLMQAVLPDINRSIEREWIPKRQAVVMEQLASLDLQRSQNAPLFSGTGGTVSLGHRLSLRTTSGVIYYTTDGSDPRDAGNPSLSTHIYRSPIAINQSMTIKARTLDGKKWSALAQGTFLIENHQFPIQISEIMSVPLGGKEFEFLELLNTSNVSLDLSWHRLKGVDFIFPFDARILPHQRLVLASDKSPSTFARRYPRLKVDGWFRGTLSSQGEPLSLISRNGSTLSSTTYPGKKSLKSYKNGHSLERPFSSSKTTSQNAWKASPQIGGTPGS